ncbi:hypothetical protein [Spirochaeta dissipatitropha]
MDSQGIHIDPKSSGYYLFQFPSSRLADLELMAAAVYRAFTQLNEIRHDLMGFSVLIDSVENTDDTSLFRSLRNRLLQAEHEDSFWIGDDARHNFEHLFRFHEDNVRQGGLSRVLGIKDKEALNIGFQQFSVDREIHDFLFSALESYYEPGYKASLKWIQSSFPLETVSTIESSVQEFLQSAFRDCYLSLRLIQDPPFVIWGEEHADVFSKQLREQIMSEPANPVSLAEQPLYRIRQQIYNCLEERLAAAEYLGKPLVLAMYCEDELNDSLSLITSWFTETMLKREIGIPVMISREEARALPHLPKKACTILDHQRLKRPSRLNEYWDSLGAKGFHALAEECDSRSQTVLFCFQLFGSSLNSEMLLEFLQEEGISPFVYPDICRHLADKGLILSIRFPLPAILDTPNQNLTWMERTERKRLMQKAELFIQRKLDKSKLQMTMQLLQIGTTVADPHRVLNWFLSLSRQLLLSGRVEEAGRLVRHAHQILGLTFSRGVAVRIRWVLWTCRMLLALAENDSESIRNLRSDVHDFSHLVDIPSADSGYVLLAIAKMNQASRNWNAALQYAKKAIISFQEAHERAGIIEANILIARCRLIQGSMWEALDYMQIALDFANPVKNTLIYAHTSVIVAAKQFLYGNYSRTREICTAIIPTCQRSGWTLLSLKLQFMLARVDFELGNYETAMQKFGTGSAYSRSIENPEALGMFLRWQIRCLSYTKAPSASIRIFRKQPQHPERDLFLGEALLLYNEYSLAQSVLDQTEEQWTELFSAQNTNPFSTGFLLIEGTGIFFESEHTYPPVLLGRCYSATAELRKHCSKQALEHMQSLLRSSSISPIDPSSAIYYYLYAQALLMADEPIEDPNAIIGKAAKQLQERSTKMDNPKDKIAYLKQNYWSQKLLDTAQAQKMV